MQGGNPCQGMNKKTMLRRFPFILFLVIMLGSCTGGVVYDHYNHTPVSGWDKADTLIYNVPRLVRQSRYVTTVGLRINGSYPFQNLTLIVDQTVFHKTGGAKLKAENFSDTLNCPLFDRKGAVKGHGISYYQYRFRVSERQLEEGDSLHITVRHNMRREVMPGIADVGISLSSTSSQGSFPRLSLGR